MNARTLFDEAMKLTPVERKALANRILRSIDAKDSNEDTDEPELTPELKSELDRRLNLIEKHPERGIPWDVAMKKLEATLKSMKHKKCSK